MSTYLIYGSTTEDIGTRVVTFREPGAPNFYDPRVSERARFLRIQFEALANRKEKVDKVVLHFDGMPDARGCYQVLIQRRLSTHLMIDWDGVVYQPLDLRDIAYHAAQVNRTGIGIDLNNPVRPNRARKLAGREVFQGRINGGVRRCLGYTDQQYDALIAVIGGLRKIFPRIKPQAPIAEDGRVLRRRLADTNFAGVLGHLHVSANKWDPGPGFDWERLLIGIRGNPLFFPVTLPGQRNLSQMPKKRALQLSEPYFRDTEEGPGGYFPVGVNQAWHTGVHLNVEAGTRVVAPAGGHVVLARNVDPTRMGSPNVVVIRHELEISGEKKVLYSVLSHLRKETLTAQSPIPWIRRFAEKPGPSGLPDDDADTPPAAPGFVALRSGRAALAGVPVKAGELIGHVGAFSPRTDGTAKKPLLDFAVVAPTPLFPRGDETFEMVDDDDDDGLLCNARAVWRRVVKDPEALRGLVEGGYPLAPAEIRDFYGASKFARELRWLCCKHVTEWSDKTDFSGLFGGGVDFEWFTRKEAKRYMQRIRKFLWWDKAVSKYLKLPRNRLMYAYHPVALLATLARGEAERAFQAGEDGYEKKLSDEELRKRQSEDARFERETGFAVRHTEVRTDDIVDAFDTDALGEDGDERSGWIRWEQGEWVPDEEE